MPSESGADLSRRLMSKGLLIRRSAIPLVESVSDLDLLIERAIENSIRLLDDDAVKRLIEMDSGNPISKSGVSSSAEIDKRKPPHPFCLRRPLCAGEAFVPGDVISHPPTPLTLASSLRVDPVGGYFCCCAKGRV